MNELFKKSLKKLELDKILQMLADHAVSAAAKESCLASAPSCDADEVRTLQEQTSDACRLMTLKGSPGLSGIRDVGASLQRADRGGCLSAEELLGIGGVLRCARNVKNYADGDSVASSLDVWFFQLMSNKYLEDKIFTCIISKDEIADAASPELASIRRNIRRQSLKIRESLQKIVSSPTYSKYLQEPIITIRSDRFVVPVKSEFKSNIPGLVHDVSSSGSTFFIEPMSAVNANNELRELLLAERKEIERILSELSAESADWREHIDNNYKVLVLLDCIFARAKLSFSMKGIEPKITDDRRIVLNRARHPLIDSAKVVPTTVSLGVDFDTLVITGPNTGGKTVTLKTLGLLTLMAQCGLHIPADDGSSISVFPQILADIGDEQSIEQSLSTFSAHMKNIVEIISVCDGSSLVLLDELGAGTDPAEGAALAISLIEYCRGCGAKIAATTHYAQLKFYAMRTGRVSNASCEFDVATLRPTYRLLVGIPGKSNAFAISRRLGLPENILQKADSLVDQNDADFEDVLHQLEVQRQQMEQARREAERLRLETERMQQESEQLHQQMQQQREKAEQQARREAQYIIDDARRTANQVYDELKELRKQMHDAADVQNSNERQAQLRRTLNEAQEKLAPKAAVKNRPAASREIRVGDTVELVKYGSKATVLSIGKDGVMQLQAGVMKLTAKPDEVYLLENQTIDNAKKVIEHKVRELKSAATPELDLRGMASDEAVAVLDQFLDTAYMGNLPTVRIIHGKGTGVLRSSVQDELRRCKYVKSFRLGVYGEGESGVTIVEFK